MNNKLQGNIGEAKAIHYYTELGYMVSKPLFENCPYDLIIDKDGVLLRVQVKTSTQRKANGRYDVNLRTMGGNRNGTGKSKNISAKEVDKLFVLLDDGRTFELNVADIDGQTAVRVG